MKTRFIICLMLIIILSGVADATVISNYSIRFDINKDLSVNEFIDINFKERVIASNLSYMFEGELSDVYLSSNSEKLNFIVSKQDSINIIKPVDNIFIDNLSMQFKTNDLVYELNGKTLFFTQLSASQDTEELYVTIMLPEGFGINDNSYAPENAITTTDGRRIYLSWNSTSISSITVKFEQLDKEFNIFILIAALAAIIALIVYIKMRKKSKDDFLKGFSEDEKKVLNYLENNPTTYQNKIEQEFKFSRAKMTRIMQKIESKGLVEKKKKGRTNKLIWKK